MLSTLSALVHGQPQRPPGGHRVIRGLALAAGLLVAWPGGASPSEALGSLEDARSRVDSAGR